MNLMDCPSDVSSLPIFQMSQALILSFMIAGLFYLIYYLISKILEYEKGIIVIKENVKELIVFSTVLFVVSLVIQFFASGSSGLLASILNLIQTSSNPQYMDPHACLYKNAEAYLIKNIEFSSYVLKYSVWFKGFLDYLTSFRYSNCVSWEGCLGSTGGTRLANIPLNPGLSTFQSIMGSVVYMLYNAVTTGATQLVLLHIISGNSLFILMSLSIILRVLPPTKYLGNIMVGTLITLTLIYPFIVFIEGYAFRIDYQGNINDHVRKEFFKYADGDFKGIINDEEELNKLKKNTLKEFTKHIVPLKPFTSSNKPTESFMIKANPQANAGLCLVKHSKDKESTLVCIGSILNLTYFSFIYSVFTLSMNLIIMIVSVKSIVVLLGERDSLIDLFMKVI